MFDDLLSLPHREFFGRAALRLPADGDLPELPVSVYRASRWHDEPGELWDGRLAPRAILGSIVLSPLAAILALLLGSPIDPLFLGVGASALCCALGAARRGRG